MQGKEVVSLLSSDDDKEEALHLADTAMDAQGTLRMKTLLLASPMALEHLPEFCDDTQIVGQVVAKDGMALKFASKRLQDDADVVRKAISSEPHSLADASTRIRSNAELVELAVAMNPVVAEYALL